MRLLLCLLISLFFVNSALAQDTLIFSSKKTLVVKVTSVTPVKVSYLKWPEDSTGMLFSTPASFLRAIHFGSGFMYEFKESRNGKKTTVKKRDSISSERKLFLKADVLSWFTYRSSFSVEHRWDATSSIEGTIGFAGFGLGMNAFNEREVKGHYYRAGVKFTFRKRHPQEGFYIKPEYVYVNYTYNMPFESLARITIQGREGILHYSDYCTSRIHGKALIINLGMQKFISKRVIIDFYGGIGVGKKSMAIEDINRPYKSEDELSFNFIEPGKSRVENHFGFISGKLNSFSPVFQAGLKIGVVF